MLFNKCWYEFWKVEHFYFPLAMKSTAVLEKINFILWLDSIAAKQTKYTCKEQIGK